MERTQAAQGVISVRGPFLVEPRTEAVGQRTATITEDITREAVQTQLTKLEQIIEYLKVLYR